MPTATAPDCVRSPATVDHVLPKAFLRRRLLVDDMRNALNDCHNLISVCRKLNQEKGESMLNLDDMHGGVLSGIQARAYLHMNWRFHGIALDTNYLSTLKSASLYNPPTLFERRRSKSIAHYTGHGNFFIDYFPLTVAATEGKK